MAFGDITEIITFGSSSYVTTTGTQTFTANPSANDLLCALHFTGDATSNVATAGFAEDLLMTNSTESDEAAIYSKVSTGASDKSVECTSVSSDSMMLIFLLIVGPFASSPADLSATSGRDAASPTATGASASSTAQASEIMVALEAIRSGGSIPTDQTGDWTRQGTATPTSAMTEQSRIWETIDTAKSIEAATQVLTATGTVGVTRAWNGTGPNAPTVVMIGYVTYKRASTSASVGLATEADSAFALKVETVVPAGLASSTESAFALGRTKTVGLGLASETDSALGVVAGAITSVGQALETDSVFSAIANRVYSLTWGTESNAAFPVGSSKALAIGLASEAESAFALVAGLQILVGLASDTETAFAIVSQKTVTVLLPVELDDAQSVGVGTAIPVGLARSLQTAFGVTAAKSLTIGIPSETSSALAVLLTRSYLMGLANESDLALQLVGQLPGRIIGPPLAAAWTDPARLAQWT